MNSAGGGPAIRRFLRRGAETLAGLPPLTAADHTRVVLLYHDVSEASSPLHPLNCSTTPAALMAQIDVVRRTFDIVDLSTVLSEHTPTARPLAAVTFDDGFRSLLDVAEPLLRQADVPFTAFLTVDAIEHGRLPAAHRATFDHDPLWLRRETFLDEEGVSALVDRGVSVGNHAWTHEQLARCSDAGLAHEVAGARERLQTLTGQAVEDLAIPFGKPEHYDQRTLLAARRAGHRAVFSSVSSAWDARRPPGVFPRVSLLNHSPRALSGRLRYALWRVGAAARA